MNLSSSTSMEDSTDSLPSSPPPDTSLRSLQLPPEVSALCLAILGINCLLNAVCLPVSALNFFLIGQTALLHRNLKFLLLLQCTCVALYAVNECVRTVPKLFTGNVFYTSPLLDFLMAFSLMCVIFIGWVGFGLLCERIMATIKCRTYEQDERPHFSLFCLLFISGATFVCYCIFIDSQQGTMMRPKSVKKTDFCLFLIYAFLAGSFVCMLIFYYILYYNKKRYTELLTQDSHKEREDLSMKYQLCENIRTSRQLFPSAILHFISVLLTISLALINYYFLLNLSWAAFFYYALIYFLYTLTHLGIQISVIIMHPMLNRRMRNLIIPLRMVRQWKRRINPDGSRRHHNNPDGNTSAAPNQQSEQNKMAEMPLNIFGDNMCQNADMEQYFKMLEKMWNK